MLKSFLLLLVVSSSFFVAAQPSEFAGKIDKYPIIMDITIYDTSCSIRYFYLNQCKDIQLEGTLNGKGDIKAKTPDQGDKNITPEVLELTKTTTGYKGWWTGNKKKLTIELQLTNASKYNNPYSDLLSIKEMKNEDPYDYIKSSYLKFQSDSTTVDGLVSLDWQKEKLSGISYPRIKKGYSAQAIKRMNESLLEQHILECLGLLRCTSSWGEYNFSVNHIYAGKHVFSINSSTSWYCGGAHPDFGQSALNFNAETGEFIKFDEAFWIGNKKPVKEDTDSWYTYRSEVFAPKLVEILKQLYPDEMKTPADENEEETCDYSEPSLWDHGNWYFTEKGIYFGAYFPRAMRPCDDPEWSVIPYDILKKHFKIDPRIKLPG